VGCRTVEPQALLVRVGIQGAHLVIDRDRRIPGRGAYLHPRPACIAAGRGGIARSLRRAVTPDDVKRIVSEMSRIADISVPFGGSLKPDPMGENVAGHGGTKTVEPPARRAD
jgi:uncharacterized protein